MTTELNHIEEDVSGFARAVVAKRLAIVAAITIVLNLAVTYGWVTPDINHQVLGWVNTGLDSVAGLAAIFWIKKDVTPSGDPRTDDGEKLVPQSVANARAEAAVAPTGGAMGTSADAPVADTTTPAA